MSLLPIPPLALIFAVACTSGSCSSSNGAADAMSDDGGTTCGQVGDSCLTISCCDGYHCCSGNPIPPGTAVCYSSACPVSDRDLKSEFSAVDAEAVLGRLADLPIATWRYVWEPADVRHMGPTAQDFKASFGLGTSARRIFSIDESGVALAAIQGLERRLERLAGDNASLRNENAALRARIERLEANVESATGSAHRRRVLSSGTPSAK
jgi:Chaperone of endosialidase